MTPRFRVWDGEEMHEPPHDYFICWGKISKFIDGYGWDHHAPVKSVMHSTGLTDAEGNEIWEGDVLRVPVLNTPVVVEYDADKARWVAVGIKYQRGLHKHCHGIIIGNRHENPELVDEVSA